MKKINKLPLGMIIKYNKKIDGGRERITEENLQEYFNYVDENKFKRILVVGAEKCIEKDNESNPKKFFCTNLNKCNKCNDNIFIADVLNKEEMKYILEKPNQWDIIVLENIMLYLIYNVDNSCIKLLLQLLKKDGQIIFNIGTKHKIPFNMLFINSTKQNNNKFQETYKNYLKNNYNLTFTQDTDGYYYDIYDIINKISKNNIFRLFFGINNNDKFFNQYEIKIESSIINDNFTKKSNNELFVITRKYINNDV